MNNIKTLAILLLTVIITSCNGSISKTEPAKRVVILGFDGLSVEGFLNSNHPNLDSLFSDGKISFKTRTVMPSVTLPNWTSHLTGSGPEQHGITGNGWTMEKHELPSVETDEEGYPISIFKLFKDQVANAKTAYYYNWAHLISPINQKYLDEVSFQEDDKYRENYNKALEFAKTHQDDPTLIFLYTVHTDHAGHKHSWMSPEYITAIEEGDKDLGVLLDKFKEAGLYDDTHFILITDHGGIGHGHGGTTPVEMNVPWAITGPTIKTNGQLNSPNNNTNTAVVIARLFGIENIPDSWVGQIPAGLFE